MSAITLLQEEFVMLYSIHLMLDTANSEKHSLTALNSFIHTGTRKPRSSAVAARPLPVTENSAKSFNITRGHSHLHS